ncbi:MAG: hypothetical protein ACRC5H_07690 [Treponemataceae bacterium]
MITACGGKPNNTDEDQLAKLLSVEGVANKIPQYDQSGRLQAVLNSIKRTVYERLPYFPEPTHPEMYGMSVGNWVNVSPLYAAAFKRVEGTNGDHRAVAFGEFQEDAIRNAVGAISGARVSSPYTIGGKGSETIGVSGIFRNASWVNNVEISTIYGANDRFVVDSVDASFKRVVPTDTDNHPYNMTTQIWVTEWFFRQFLETSWLDAGFELPY